MEEKGEGGYCHLPLCIPVAAGVYFFWGGQQTTPPRSAHQPLWLPQWDHLPTPSWGLSIHRAFCPFLCYVRSHRCHLCYCGEFLLWSFSTGCGLYSHSLMYFLHSAPSPLKPHSGLLLLAHHKTWWRLLLYGVSSWRCHGPLHVQHSRLWLKHRTTTLLLPVMFLCLECAHCMLSAQTASCQRQLSVPTNSW